MLCPHLAVHFVEQSRKVACRLQPPSSTLLYGHSSVSALAQVFSCRPQTTVFLVLALTWTLVRPGDIGGHLFGDMADGSGWVKLGANCAAWRERI